MKKYALLGVAFMFLIQGQAQDYKNEIFSGYQGPINLNIEVNDNATNFIVMGDWGRMGGFSQQKVADQMATTAITAGIDFVISVGDNFYPNGVQSIMDHQWKSSFEDIYTSVNLHENWVVALGNHDYRGNIQAQIDYSQISRRWYMPNTYYDTLIPLEEGQWLQLIVLDTNPFIDKYQKDPVKYPQLSAQNTKKQIQWLKDRLSVKNSDIKWRVVVGHHPMYSGAKRKGTKELVEIENVLSPIFEQYKVDAYICGHEHDLQIVKPASKHTVQFLSGSASEIRPTGKTEGTIMAAAEPGFMLFSIHNNALLVQSINESGKVIHKYTLTK